MLYVSRNPKDVGKVVEKYYFTSILNLYLVITNTVAYLSGI